MSLSRIDLVPLELLLFVAHPAPPVIQLLILALGKACRLVVHEELLRDRFFLIFLRQSIDPASNATIVHHCSNAEIFWQLLAIIAFIEALGEDLVPHLDGAKVHLELLSHLNLGHVSPGLASVILTLLLPLLLLQCNVVQRLDTLCICSYFTRSEERMLLEKFLGLALLRLLHIQSVNLLVSRFREERRRVCLLLLYEVFGRFLGENGVQTFRHAFLDAFRHGLHFTHLRLII